MLDAADEAPAERSVAALLARVEGRLAAILAEADERREAESARRAQQPEGPAAERSWWARRAREVLHLLGRHPGRLLAGFDVRSVEDRETGHGWGELVVTLQRGPDELRLHVVPRSALPRAFRCTASLAVSHADDTPGDTPDAVRVIDVFARALERYAAVRGRAGPPDQGVGGGRDGAPAVS